MSLIDRARSDARRIVSSLAGFALPITFSVNDSVAIVNGTAKKHYTQFDDMGNAVSSMNASVTVSELDLIALEYPLRNSNNEINLRGHKVTWSDALGSNSYTIAEWYPDNHLGLIVCILTK